MRAMGPERGDLVQNTSCGRQCCSDQPAPGCRAIVNMSVTLLFLRKRQRSSSCQSDMRNMGPPVPRTLLQLR